MALETLIVRNGMQCVYYDISFFMHAYFIKIGTHPLRKECFGFEL